MENKIAHLLLCTPEILNWADKQEVESLKSFLTSDISRPLICIGSGGSFSVCSLIALAYGTIGGIAKAVTPLSVYSLSESVLAKCKILLISTSGANKDISTIAKLCVKLNPAWTANLTLNDSDRNKLKKIIAAATSFNYKRGIADGFISVNSVTAGYALVLKAFGLTDLIIPEESVMEIPDCSGINHFLVLYGSWGEPAAIDFESKLVESGTATCAVSDFRNFCHGRFIFASNHCGHEKKAEVPADCAVVMMTTPREKKFADKLKALLPERCPVINLHSDFYNSKAALDMMLKTSLLAGEIAAAKGIDPLNPKNYGGIDKRAPQQIPFQKDLKDFGPLKI